MAAVLGCGPGATLSHGGAGAHWGFRPSSLIEVSVPAGVFRCRPGIAVHRRSNLTAADTTTHRGIPVTSPICTLIDFAARLPSAELERAINEADRLGLVTPVELRAALDSTPPRPGVAVVRKTLDRRTFRMTRSELERRFIPIAVRAGYSRPLTRQWVNGFEVDFYWPDLGLVVETDGLRYHRTPAQQAVDRIRDQTHTAAGLTQLRFTHEQVRYGPRGVEQTMRATRERLVRRPTAAARWA